MMSSDVKVSESIYHNDAQEKYEEMHDERFDRDARKDLHEGIDLVYDFVKSIKSLHPLAQKQIKSMIYQGNLI